MCNLGLLLQGRFNGVCLSEFMSLWLCSPKVCRTKQQPSITELAGVLLHGCSVCMWLWWFFIIYLYISTGYVCAEYFLEAQRLLSQVFSAAGMTSFLTLTLVIYVLHFWNVKALFPVHYLDANLQGLKAWDWHTHAHRARSSHYETFFLSWHITLQPSSFFPIDRDSSWVNVASCFTRCR